MKKYISLLSIASAFLMQSCERSDSDVKNYSTNESKHENFEP